MYISKFELKNIRGVGPEGLTVDLAKPAIKARGRLAGWTVIAGPNGYGKTTLLQGMAASLMGPSGGRLLIGPDDNRWLALGAESGTTITWVEHVPEDDCAAPDDETLKPVRLRVDWLRGGSVRTTFPRGNHNFVYSQFWDAFNVNSRPNGWIFLGYGPHRSIQRSSNDAYQVIDQTRPRASAVVGLFRYDAALEKGHEWLKTLALGKVREDAAKEAVLEGVVRLLRDRLLQPDREAELNIDEEGVLKLRAPSGVELPVYAIGEGSRMLLNMVLDMLYQIDRFKPGRLLEEMVTWLGAPESRPVIEISGVVVIDEPENHLHPALQQRLGFWMKDHFPNLQFIVCTHSALICQAADKGGLFRMASPFQVEVVGEDEWEAVTNGTLDDAIMTNLFGLSDPVAPEGRKIRAELGELEREMQRRSATPEMIARREALLSQLPNSIDFEVATALRRLAEGG